MSEKLKSKPSALAKAERKSKSTVSKTPSSRSKAITIPKLKKPRVSSRVPLYLLTEPDEMLGGNKLHPGAFENPKPGEIRAYEPNDLVYEKLSTRNARYLHVDRIWPVMVDETAGLVRDDKRHGWKFRVVHLEPPLALAAPATWQRLLDAGLARTPRLKRQPSLLVWAAIKGHVGVIRTLLDGGAHIPADDVVMALLRELKV
ncbi:MAG: hypothetical protein H0V17_15045 [Deltaproteobacteria bacterium]|nr:hypothetical protein [Deltaproteobacteria bacterium]